MAFFLRAGHNGQVPLMDDHPDHWLGDVKGERFYSPVGSTDSEALFCAILNALRAQFVRILRYTALWIFLLCFESHLLALSLLVSRLLSCDRSIPCPVCRYYMNVCKSWYKKRSITTPR